MMKKLKFKSLTMRIWTTFVIIILVIVCSISLIYLVAYRKINENAKTNDLKVTHDILLNILVKSSDFDQPGKFDKLKNLKGSRNFIYKIDDNNNPVIMDMDNKDAHTPDNNDVPKEYNAPPPPMENEMDLGIWMMSFVKTDNVNEKQFIKMYKNRSYIFIISSITNKKNTTANKSTSEKNYLISYIPDMQDNSILYSVIVIGLIFIAIGFLVSKIVANYISKPLKKLEDYTKRIAKKDWKEPIEVTSSDEIGRLAESMNHMQKELKRADEEEKTFLQSISHDLKTPVMVIMSHAEAIIEGVYIGSVEKNAEIIRDESISLEKKIKELLYLNTLDYVLDNSSKSEVVNLHDLILNVVDRFEAVKSEIEWNLHLDKVNIEANNDEIRISIQNILDNALRYAENEIKISLKKENSCAVLEIYNDGPNIPQEHIGHIFENMYKDKTGNFGLGLTISKKVINFYKGSISALNRDKGVSFIIKFPLV